MRSILLCFALATAPLAAHAAPPGEQGTGLAKARGCTTCHAFQPEKAGANAVPPPAPALSDIARRYRGVPGAEEKLVAVVMRGSSPTDRHWAGKAGAAAMPANPARISEADAKELIRWILQLD